MTAPLKLELPPGVLLHGRELRPLDRGAALGREEDLLRGELVVNLAVVSAWLQTRSPPMGSGATATISRVS